MLSTEKANIHIPSGVGVIARITPRDLVFTEETNGKYPCVKVEKGLCVPISFPVKHVIVSLFQCPNWLCFVCVYFLMELTNYDH